MKIETRKILSNPHARRAYYETLRARRAASANRGLGVGDSENQHPTPDTRHPSAATELLQWLRAMPESAPIAEEWEVRKRRREENRREVAMID